MATVVRPRVARMHAREAQNDWHTVVTGIDVENGLNDIFKAVADLATLAAAIAYILSILAPIGSDGLVKCGQPVGDLHALANNIIATYPSGNIPAVPLT